MMDLEIIKVPANDEAFVNFMTEREDDIDEIFPHFDKDNLDMTEISFLKSSNRGIGVFISEYKGEELHVMVDYVIPEFRDIGIGEEFFSQNLSYFKEMGFKSIVALTDNERHKNYLKRCGFKNAEKLDDLFEMNLFTNS